MKTVLVTGSAGFIGFHLSKILLQDGYNVLGLDGFTDYYDINLKHDRQNLLKQHDNFCSLTGRLEDFEFLKNVFLEYTPSLVVHLAAQAGVRYSIDNPRSYLESNIVGAFNILELSRLNKVEHLLMASTSSVYGANEALPYSEIDNTDRPMSFYAATKKANESMAHSYAHIWNIPITMFRFFTVYGPWGRPDMALFKFVDGILKGNEIDIYNNGEMYRDFTYVEDLAYAICLLMKTVPENYRDRKSSILGDTVSAVAPYRVVNIGNSKSIKLTDFVDAIEIACGRRAKRRYLDMQQGDVPKTWADAQLLKKLTGYAPQMDISQGVQKFVSWYRDYYQV